MREYILYTSGVAEEIEPETWLSVHTTLEASESCDTIHGIIAFIRVYITRERGTEDTLLEDDIAEAQAALADPDILAAIKNIFDS